MHRKATSDLSIALGPHARQPRDYSVSGFLQGRPQRGHEQPDPETEADKPEQRFGDWQRGTDLRASTGLR